MGGKYPKPWSNLQKGLDPDDGSVGDTVDRYERGASLVVAEPIAKRRATFLGVNRDISRKIETFFEAKKESMQVVVVSVGRNEDHGGVPMRRLTQEQGGRSYARGAGNAHEPGGATETPANVMGLGQTREEAGSHRVLPGLPRSLRSKLITGGA